MKTIFAMLCGFGFMGFLICIVWKTKPKIGHKSKDQIVIVTSQIGMIDTFKINAAYIRLDEGDLIYQNDTDRYNGEYHVLVSGVYKFKIETNDRAK